MGLSLVQPGMYASRLGHLVIPVSSCKKCWQLVYVMNAWMNSRLDVTALFVAPASLPAGLVVLNPSLLVKEVNRESTCMEAEMMGDTKDFAQALKATSKCPDALKQCLSPACPCLLPVQEVNLESTSVTAEMMVAMKDSAQAMAGVHKKM